MNRKIHRRGNSYPLSRDLAPHLVAIADCKPLGRATRKHPPHQVRKLAASISRFGFVLPILLDAERRVVGGWGLVLAARQLGLNEVPAVSLTDLPEADLRMLRLALNRITDDAAWDREALSLEFSDLLKLEPQIDLEVSGFEIGVVMGSGELSRADFKSFLKTAFGHAASRSIDGSIHFVCMDWRHQREILAAVEEVYAELKALCIWNKTNAGMGSLYRSKHELIYVFKVGKGAHINNVALGKYGRHRTNVWDYVGQSGLNGTSKSKLAVHPTAKPVAMIADAIRDCSNRGGLILDPFGGAGTTLIAAERTGRRARVIELNPIFVDVSIERWQRLTGGTAIHADSGRPFARSASSSAADMER